MTENQIMALIRYVTDRGINITLVIYCAFYNEQNDDSNILRVEYHDSGGNYHSVGITEIGTLRTYAESYRV
jgi:hypothetical protein